MSSASVAVTYTSVYTDSELGRVFWGADEELSDEGSPRVIVYGYNGLPMQPVAPPSPDYIPGPEEPQTPPVSQDEDECEPMFIQPHDPDYVPEPMYPEYILLEDEHVLLVEEQPLPHIISPTAESPGYVVESDPKGDPEEYEDDESKYGLADYPIDEGDDGDDDDDDSSRDDADDEEEEEHLASANSAVVVPTVEPDHCLASGDHTATLPSPLLPPLPPSLYISPLVDRRDDVPESELPPRKRSCLSTLGSRYEIGESSTARPTGGRGIDYGFVSTLDAEARRRGIREVRYGIRDTWVDTAKAVHEIPPMTLGKRVDLLMKDRIAYQVTILIVKEEAYASREAWAHSIGLSQAVHYELQTHRKQAELLALREQQRRARQPGLDARVPDHQDASRDANSHI
nr:hypothetical protein [Tanacetum cinerariifolium]